MGKQTESNEKANESKGEFKIVVQEHEPFDAITDSTYMTSTAFGEKVSALFKSVFRDCEGCAFEINQQGQAYIAVYFNHNEAPEDGRAAAVSRDVGTTSNIHNETVKRVRNNDNRNRFGDRYYLTNEGKEGIDDFLFDYLINRNNGKIQWDRITADVSQQGQMYGQRALQYTKVSMLDPVKLASVIFGDTDENGERVEYGVSVLKSAPQMSIGNFQPVWILEIKRVFEKSLVGVCNSLGLAPSSGLNIIR